MDQDLLEQFVGKYAHFVYDTDPTSDNRRARNDNPTGMLVITKMKTAPVTCLECYRSCDHTVAKCYTWDFKLARWNKSCQGCKRIFNHATGVFEFPIKRAVGQARDPATGAFSKKQLGDQATTDGEQ